MTRKSILLLLIPLHFAFTKTVANQNTVGSLIALIKISKHDTTTINKFFENRNLNPDLKRNIFLVLKESLNNILKYAHAKYVLIEFKINNGNFEFKIKDDGNGFDVNHVSGNGLNNMKFRIQQSDGILKIASSKGEGCEVLATGKLFNL